MNVLVYSGPGTTTEGVKHCLESLRLHLSPYYAVIPITETSLVSDPWPAKTSLLVIPGGADIPYCKSLNGKGNQKISKYVKKGGKFLGICAGGYFASERCEFETGNPQLEVSGSRELSFFPGTAKGCAFKGFVYESHAGAKAAELSVNTEQIRGIPTPLYNYYNGGGVFLNATSYPNITVLARYVDPLDIEDNDKAAVIHCSVGKGDVILSGTHPEYSSNLLRSFDPNDNFTKVLDTLSDHDFTRRMFFRACLVKLGLRVNEDVNATVPRITPIYLSSHLQPGKVQKILSDLKENIDFVDRNTFEDKNDTFSLHDESEDDLTYFMDQENDPQHAVKHVKFLTSGNLPENNVTPYFNMKDYFDHLKELSGSELPEIGSILGYSEVVTSTSTLLEANQNWLKYLPHGIILTATTQVSGRGRGGNVWINPKGVMAQSILFKIPSGARNSASIVTLQYLCSIALIESILGYGSPEAGKGSGYEDMPIRLKWPNDIYALKPEYFNDLSDKDKIDKTVDGDDEKYAKVSGAMINSQFFNGFFHLVFGAGINVSNSAPTTSLNLVLQKLNTIRENKGLNPLPPYRHELLLAKIVYTMDNFYKVFQSSGLRPFLPLYYKRWFHSNQIVKLDAEGNGTSRNCIIKGITSDYGLLIAEDLETHEKLELQPNGNSFDMFRGLVYKKNT